MGFNEFWWKNIRICEVHFFLVQLWDSSVFRSLSLVSKKKYRTFKVQFFPSSDLRFKSFLCGFSRFLWKKIPNFQTSLNFQFRCEIQFIFMRFHKFKWENIEFSKFNFFPVQMWDWILFHSLSIFSMKKYRTFKVHWFFSSYIRFNAFSFAFIFHVKYWFFNVYFFPSSDQRFNAFHAIS
jgi:hypothetical protein